MSIVDLEARARAATDLDRSYLVTAGAGTGKTSLLVERYLSHVLERGTPIARLAAITFTRKAAAEMRLRVEESLHRILVISRDAASSRAPADTDAGASGHDASRDDEASRVFARLGPAARELAPARARLALDTLETAPITTIHGFCSDVVRRHADRIGIPVEAMVDEGTRAEEIRRNEWVAFLAEDPAASERQDAWRRAFSRVDLSHLAETARVAFGFNCDLDALAAESESAQKALVKRLAGSLRAEFERLAPALLAVPDIQSGVRRFVVALGEALRSLEDGTLDETALSATGLAKSVTIGRKVDDPDAEQLLEEIREIANLVRELAVADPALGESIAGVVEPFARRARAKLLAEGILTHDSLIVLARDLLRDDLEARVSEQALWDHLLLDEFQDTDPRQYELVLLLAEDRTRSAQTADNETETQRRDSRAPPVSAFDLPLVTGRLFVVGDAKQSIYRFRGADVRLYRRAVEALRREGAEEVELESNFRSRPELVEPLNRLFESYLDPAQGDPEYTPLVASRPALGRPAIEVWSVRPEVSNADGRRRAEAVAIAERIAESIRTGRYLASEIAILFRAMTVADPYTRELGDRGVPFVRHSAREFFDRHEVELYLCALRLLARPDDAAALVACLRSPMGAVPDLELQLHAERSSSRWALDAEVDAECPSLARALEQLRDVVTRLRELPIDLAAVALLDETPLRAAMAASHDGAQKTANLEKAARRVAELAWSGERIDRIVDRLCDADSGLRRVEGDSPLVDEGLDAVRVLTVHSAKGLEWPCVIVADLARETQPRRDGIVLETYDATTFAARAARRHTPAEAILRREERVEAMAEAKRLFYVATTRARDELVLVASLGGTLERSWIEPLVEWGYASPAAGANTREEHFLDHGRVTHRILSGGVDPSEPDSGAGDRSVAPSARRSSRHAVDSTLKAAADRFREARIGARVGRDESPLVLAASSHASEPSAGARSAQTPARSRLSRPIARAVGSATHRLLELWIDSDVEWLFANAKAAARLAAASEGVSPAAVEKAVRDLLLRSRARGTLDLIARQPSLAREIPLLHVDEDGSIIDGIIDALVGDPDSPEILDYKTDAASSQDDLESRHGEQLEHYRRGLALALGLSTPPATRILGLDGTLDRRDVDDEPPDACASDQPL